MVDDRGLAVQAVALKVLADRVAARRKLIGEQLAATMGEGDRLSARLDSGTAVGAVTYTNPSTKARIVNEPQLIKWVAENHPDELIQAIRPSFLVSLLDYAQKTGDPVTRDGELLPGVQVIRTDGYISIRPDTEQIPALLDAIRGGYDLALEP